MGDRYLETWHSGGLAFRELAFGVLGIKRPDIQGASIEGTGIQGGRVQGADIQRASIRGLTWEGRPSDDHTQAGLQSAAKGAHGDGAKCPPFTAQSDTSQG